jgi:uncharacterized protein YndB with AHSA1/START domain
MSATQAKPAASPSSGFEFVIKRSFDAPLERVWKAWTDPAQLARWWGPKGSKGEILKLELKPGGVCHYRLDTPDGTEIWGKAIYREVVPNDRLVFVQSFSDENEGITVHPLNPDWPRQILSTVTFSEREGKTTVIVRWVPYEATDSERETFEAGADSMRGGWSGSLDQLEAYLART